MPTINQREKILQKAIVLFAQYGYINVSMLEVAFDSSITLDKLQAYFPDKATLLLGAMAYIPECHEHYYPGEKDIDEMAMLDVPPAEILARLVYFYEKDQGDLLHSIYRFAYTQALTGRDAAQRLYPHIWPSPTRNGAYIIDMMAKRHLIAPCNSNAIASLWNRTSLTYEMLSTYHHMEANRSTYHPQYIGMTQFFIDQIVCGTVPECVSGIPLPCYSNMSPEQILSQAPSARLSVLCEALSLFDQYGYLAVSMNQIARAVNMPLTQLCQMFPDKVEIIGELAELLIHRRREYGEARVVSQALALENHQEAVLLLDRAYFPGIDALTLSLYRVLYRDQYYSEDLGTLLLDTILTDIQEVAKTLDQLGKAGDIPTCDSQKVAIAFVYALCSFSISLTAFDGEDYDGQHQDMLQVISLLLNMMKGGTQSSH